MLVWVYSDEIDNWVGRLSDDEAKREQERIARFPKHFKLVPEDLAQRLEAALNLYSRVCMEIDDFKAGE